MANLRTNNLCGEGGRDAYNGSVYFDGNYSFLSLGSGVIPTFGTNDFTIEFWINQGVNASNYTIIFNLHTTDAKGFEIAFHSGTIQVYTDTGAWRDTGYTPVSGEYEHIAFQRDYSGNTLKMYANGVEKWSVSNQVNYNSTVTYANIGSYNIGAYGHFQGYISNLRVCTGHLVYSSNYFTPPTSPLTVHFNSEDDKTVLLCCQDSDDPTKEATGKTITANGSTSLVNRTDNLIENGNFEQSATEGWTLSGGTAALSTGQSGTFGDGNHVLLTATSSYAYLKQAFTTVIGRTYRVNVQSNGGDASFISTTTSESDAVITDIRSATQTTNGRISSKNFVATQTTYYMILRGNTGGANFDTAAVYEEANPTPPRIVPPFGVDAGNTFNGAISMNSPSWMYFQTGKTEERGRGRAVTWLGGNDSGGSYTDEIDFFEIQTLGTTAKFGEISDTVGLGAGMSSSTRGIFAGGSKPGPGGGNQNFIEYITIATTGNAKDFGGISTLGRYVAGISNQTRGIIAGAYQGGGASGTLNTMQFVTIATLGTSEDFGDIVANSGNGIQGAGSCSSPTRGITFGGGTPSTINEINYLTIGTLGNSVDFGDLSAARYLCQGVSSSTRGVVAGGDNSGAVNVIEYITIATTGNASDFGDLLSNSEFAGSSGASNKIRGVFTGRGDYPSYDNAMSYITIATEGNAFDFGDVRTSGGTPYGSTNVSGSHGGLS